ncbi:MAG: DUF445 domain-containing protein, partial [Gammaproteobacteria bacterium]|nr:DUF445 domain-containing protein [Gammaproteobacteria bacterium]
MDLSTRLQDDLDSPDSRVRAEIAGWLERVAGDLAGDEDMQAWINE